MKVRALCAMTVLAGMFVLASADDAQAFELFDRMFNRGGNGCCDVEPSCCEPEPVCCEPEPVCCEPEPTCCEADDCCGRGHRRPLRDLLSKLFHHHRGCNDCCGMEASCCEPEPTCGCGY